MPRPCEHLDSRERKQWNDYKAACRKRNPEHHNDKYCKQVRAAYKAQTQGYTLDRWISPPVDGRTGGASNGEGDDTDARRFHDGFRE